MGVTALGEGRAKASNGETKSKGDFDGSPDDFDSGACAGVRGGAAEVGREVGLLELDDFVKGSRDEAATIGSLI